MCVCVCFFFLCVCVFAEKFFLLRWDLISLLSLPHLFSTAPQVVLFNYLRNYFTFCSNCVARRKRYLNMSVSFFVSSQDGAFFRNVAWRDLPCCSSSESTLFTSWATCTATTRTWWYLRRPSGAWGWSCVLAKSFASVHRCVLFSRGICLLFYYLYLISAHVCR